MRTTQIMLRFDAHEEHKQVWAQVPAADRTEIARRYARLLVKAAKVDPRGPKQQTEQTS